MSGFERGDVVEVEGHGGRRAVLRVWQDHGRGLTLSSERGYARALAGDPEAPLVGFPRVDIKRRVAQDGDDGRLAGSVTIERAFEIEGAP